MVPRLSLIKYQKKEKKKKMKKTLLYKMSVFGKRKLNPQNLFVNQMISLDHSIVNIQNNVIFFC